MHEHHKLCCADFQATSTPASTPEDSVYSVDTSLIVTFSSRHVAADVQTQAALRCNSLDRSESRGPPSIVKPAEHESSTPVPYCRLKPGVHNYWRHVFACCWAGTHKERLPPSLIAALLSCLQDPSLLLAAMLGVSAQIMSVTTVFHCVLYVSPM